MAEVSQFFCAVCEVPVTGLLTRITSKSVLRSIVANDEVDLVPTGRYIEGAAALEAGFSRYIYAESVWRPEDVLFCTGDVRQSDGFVSADIGCCGYTGSHGSNMFCTNRHPVGTQITECSMPHLAYAPLANLIRLSEQHDADDEPDDDPDLPNKQRRRLRRERRRES